jgi:hypothetical protein
VALILPAPSVCARAQSSVTLAWNPCAGSHCLTARAVYDSGNTVSSAPANVTVTILPAPWQTVDVGNVAVAGSASISGGLHTVAGAGKLSGTADSSRFLYQPLSGDGSIQACISSAQSRGSCHGFGGGSRRRPPYPLNHPAAA